VNAPATGHIPLAEKCSQCQVSFKMMLQAIQTKLGDMAPRVELQTKYIFRTMFS